MPYKRDLTIDTLRGLAIFTMVAANMAGQILIEPHPLWFRLYGTFAAPLFVLMSGMMVAYTTQGKNYTLGYFVIRGALVVAVGALLDLFLWWDYPFINIDVLYLIGLSMPLSFLFLRLNVWGRWALAIAVFAATPILQFTLGYAETPLEFDLMGGTPPQLANLGAIGKHWLMDGWFPMFPWLGFAFLGALFADWRWKVESRLALGKAGAFAIGLAIPIAGSPAWWLMPATLLTRDGYSELFYPPTISFMAGAVGLIIVLFSIVDWTQRFPGWKPLQALGESSLFMYIFHLVIVTVVIARIWPENGIAAFAVIYVVFIAFLIAVAYGLRVVKARWKNKPFLVKFLLGG